MDRVQQEMRTAVGRRYKATGKVGSTAVGAYQILASNINAAVHHGIVDYSDTFDAVTQAKIALWLLNQNANVRAYVATGDTKYLHKAAIHVTKQWAIFPGPDGKSQYHYGKVRNRAGATLTFEDAIQVIVELRELKGQADDSTAGN